MSDRRKFLVKAGGAMAAAGAGVITGIPNVIAQPKVQWRMSTTATPALDIQQGAAHQLARMVDEMSGGRFRIEVFPGGQIMPPFACFGAASQGTIEAFMASSYYWTEKERLPPGAVAEPAVEWFTTIPFGMNPEGMVA
jgi:TRAP-type mannitol/chloroaromatic compound transport system substrate-binding protein